MIVTQRHSEREELLEAVYLYVLQNPASTLRQIASALLGEGHRHYSRIQRAVVDMEAEDDLRSRLITTDTGTTKLVYVYDHPEVAA